MNPNLTVTQTLLAVKVLITLFARQVVDTLVRSGGVDMIVVDSVAALTPRAEIEGEIGSVLGAPFRCAALCLEPASCRAWLVMPSEYVHRAVSILSWRLCACAICRLNLASCALHCLCVEGKLTGLLWLQSARKRGS